MESQHSIKHSLGIPAFMASIVLNSELSVCMCCLFIASFQDTMFLYRFLELCVMTLRRLAFLSIMFASILMFVSVFHLVIIIILVFLSTETLATSYGEGTHYTI
jgi:hypothetical protein